MAPIKEALTPKFSSEEAERATEALVRLFKTLPVAKRADATGDFTKVHLFLDVAKLKARVLESNPALDPSNE